MKTLYYLLDDPHTILNYVTHGGQVAYHQYKRVSVGEVFERRKNNHDLKLANRQRVRDLQGEISHAANA